jgi:hypothetical protein
LTLLFLRLTFDIQLNKFGTLFTPRFLLSLVNNGAGAAKKFVKKRWMFHPSYHALLRQFKAIGCRHFDFFLPIKFTFYFKYATYF